MNTCIAGHRGVRDGVIHAGAAALLLGAALSMNSTHAMAPSSASAAAAAKAEAADAAAAKAAAAKAEVEEHKEVEEREEVEERLRDAQERMNRAASEVAAIASERARQAMGAMKFTDGMGPSRGPAIGVDLDPKSIDGALVRDVSPGGPAEEAGIRAGDVIVNVNGNDVRTDVPGDGARQVVQELQAFRGKLRKDPDAKLKIRVLREGQPKDFEVTPRRINNAFAFSPPFALPNISGPSGDFNYSYKFFGGNSDLAGLEVTTLTPQLGRYFGASKGVLVVRAPKSDTYKLQDGDVIVAIDGREPTSGSHITRILSSYQPGEQVTLRVMRDHKTQDIRVTVPDRRQSRWGGPDAAAGEPM